MTMHERRGHDRFSITSLADVEVEGSKERIEAYVMNVSRNGVGLYSPTPLAVGNVVHVHLTFNHHGELHTESACGEVIRSNPHVGVHLVGVRFDGLSEADHPELIGFIAERERQLAVQQ
ncbi:MAG: PilZ domain-containing protein [Nitrospirae bacterium]|nr:PilZ domain-containing protein [Nitrospirota bacterium]